MDWGGGGLNILVQAPPDEKPNRLGAPGQASSFSDLMYPEQLCEGA